MHVVFSIKNKNRLIWAVRHCTIPNTALKIPVSVPPLLHYRHSAGWLFLLLQLRRTHVLREHHWGDNGHIKASSTMTSWKIFGKAIIEVHWKTIRTTSRSHSGDRRHFPRRAATLSSAGWRARSAAPEQTKKAEAIKVGVHTPQRKSHEEVQHTNPTGSLRLERGRAPGILP